MSNASSRERLRRALSLERMRCALSLGVLRRRLGHAFCALVTVAVACATLLLGAPVHAAPARVERFTPTTWRQWQATLSRPTAVVFTTTDCAYCPAVVAALRSALAEGRLRAAGAELAAVVMDVAPGADDAALLADAHYRPADRLLAFDGPAGALRHAVEPRWRGVTPAVALLAPGLAPRWIVGTPNQAQLADWARALDAARR